MTRNSVLASELYKNAVTLKKMDFNILARRSQREKVISTLAMMQFLTCCVGMKHISDEQTEIILSSLTNTYSYDVSSICEILVNSSADSDFSVKYNDLLFQMNLILSSCVSELSQKNKGYKESAMRYILAFHNLPRAFLPLDDKRKASPSEAWDYSKSYFN